MKCDEIARKLFSCQKSFCNFLCITYNTIGIGNVKLDIHITWTTETRYEYQAFDEEKNYNLWCTTYYLTKYNTHM